MSNGFNDFFNNVFTIGQGGGGINPSAGGGAPGQDSSTGGFGGAPSRTGGGTGTAGMIGDILKGIGPLLSGFGKNSAAQGNARIAEMLAASMREEAAQRASVIRRTAAATAAQGRVNFAKAGVDPDSGTPLLVELASKDAGEADAQAALRGGANKASYTEAQAQLFKKQGSDALMGGLFGSAGGLATGNFGKGLLS